MTAGGDSGDEGEPVPLSALQHHIVCPRQVALIQVEQQWLENQVTAEGRIEHERVDQRGGRSRDGVRRRTGLSLRSHTLGIVGRADVVEFHPAGDGGEVVFPVEHKRGKPKRHDGDRVQLCAQAMCLEEMLDADIPAGALFYGQQRRRVDVAFEPDLRERTREVAAAVRELIASGRTPPPVPCPACPSCSLKPRCRPDELAGADDAVAGYLTRQLHHAGDGDLP
jgi:CRISPR-associated exonuclease Cas4